ncbi:MAG: hypothetical protein ACRD9S_17825 [Pyrinomonadaceae bacterium]
MTLRTPLTSIAVFMLLVSFPVLQASAQKFSVENKVQESAWKSGKYIPAGSSLVSIGDIFSWDKTVTKYPGSCFAGLQTNTWQDYTFARDYVVWKRRPLDIFKKLVIDAGLTKGEGRPDQINAQATLEVSEGADKILANISFKGPREEVHPQILSNYAAKSNWAGECGDIARASDSYVTVVIARGYVRVGFYETVRGKRNSMDFVMPPWWKKVTDDNGDVLFEREVVLLIARHPKLKTQRSKVVGMELTEEYLRHL